LLDVGGGNGCVTRALLDAGHAAVLLEPGADGVRHARARGVAPIIHSTLEAAGIVRAVLPAVGLFDVIEHVADDAAFLRRIRGLMVPRGRLYVTVPALDWIWSTADVSAGHHRRYSRTGLTLKLEAAGFEVEYASHFFAILPVPIFIGRSLRGRILGPGDAQTRARIEHRPRSALLRRALAGMTRLECHWVRRGTRLPTGSSCLAVARA
jgi:SAM-dependent methyltransferase